MTGRPFIDITGKRFGRLVVIEKADFVTTDPNDSQYRWTCLCDCGKTVVVRSFSLRRGQTKSCGCLLLDYVPSNKLPYGVSARHRLYTDYKKRSVYGNSRGTILFDLSYDEFINLTQLNCVYCDGVPSNRITPLNNKDGGVYVYNGIDRVDSTKGYTKDNCVTCCEICNRAKKDMTIDDFMSWIRRLTEKNK